MLNKLRKLKEKKGFTLVELIVVIAIIAILTAVLVPLIGNWTQQAAYTTLQDGAQTISNTVNEAISKIVAGGAPLASTITTITGVKTAGGANNLTITVGTETGNAGETVTSSDTVPKRVAVEIAKMLDATMPNTSAFTAKITNGAVAAVAYTNSFSDIPSGTVSDVDNFDNAFEATVGSATAAVGVTGEYKVDGATIS